MSPTHQRILKVLSDGHVHTTEQLTKCLYDELSTTSTLRVHLTVIRKELRKVNQDIIVHRVEGVTCYQHVIVLPITAKIYSR